VSAAATKTAPKTKTTAAASTKKGSGTKAIVTRTAEKTVTPQVPDKTETASKTTAKKSSTPAVPEDTVVVPVGDQAAASQGSDKGGDEAPQSAPLQRVKFNMRPESERSANTDRVNKLEEFKDVTVKRVIKKKAPIQQNESAQPEVPEVDSGKGRDQSALQGGGNAPQVAMNTPAEDGAPAAPEVNDAPDRPHEDYSVQYIGPEVLNPAPPIRRGPGRPYPIPRQAYVRRMPPPPPPVRRAPIVPSATEARRMADDLSQIEDVEVHVVPN
jgi:hypothetical protein